MSRSEFDASIVTVNWNGQRHLAQLLPSLVGQGAREIIVVDNGSTDGSQEFLRRHHPQVKILQNRTNLGFAQPNNLAAREAKGRFLAFINNDMRAAPGWLEEALRCIRPESPCAASRILDWEGQRIDFNGSSLQYLGYALQEDIGRLVEEVTDRNRILFPCGGSMVIRRSVFLELGGFDEDYFAVYEDVDLGWRLWIAGFQVVQAPRSISYHRGHATFREHPDEKVRYLMHRNALWTILKNYEEETFRKILPLSLILAVKRATLFSGVDRDSLHLWSGVRKRIEAGDLVARSQFVDALNHLVAVDDVWQSLPRLLEKRRLVQRSRRRPDSEILGWFVDPLRPIVEHPLYIDEEFQYLERLGLTSLFDLTRYQSYRGALPHVWEERVEQLRREVLAWQWIGVQNCNHPSFPGDSGWRQVVRRIRQRGLRTVWKDFLERVASGI